MFERRLKIVIIVLILFTLVLLGRVFAMQVVKHAYWVQKSADLLTHPQLTETTRGRIFDSNGVLMAEDVPCTDACVDYRAIIDPPDPKWVADITADHLQKQLGVDWKKGLSRDLRKNMFDTEQARVLQQIHRMWETLAILDSGGEADPGSGGATAIAAARHDIIQNVEKRRADQNARLKEKSATQNAKSSAVMQWVFAGGEDTASAGSGIVLKEEEQPHVIIHSLDAAGCNLLGKHEEEFPGLVLRPSTHRLYLLHDVAAHVMGRMSRVSAADLEPKKQDKLEETRRYLATDTIGREGIEALCEPLLRGGRGKIETQIADGTVVDEVPFQPGQDVQLSLDSRLQNQVQQMLQHVEIKLDGSPITPAGGVSMHAAAVVLEVSTNQVLAMASNPGFDVNDLETRYAQLVNDHLNEPMRNRATADEMVPGSTAKPMIGLGAIKQGVLKPREGIECTGYLVLPVVGADGKTRQQIMSKKHYRCWVASEYLNDPRLPNGNPAHHPIPLGHPHRGIYGNPDGFLTISDAIERSCNIFFETVADRLGPAGVDRCYEDFGIGRPTGIGIYERPGQRPGQIHQYSQDSRMANCLTGIGQGVIAETPLQVANEAATLARDGVWMRPSLLSAETQARLNVINHLPPLYNESTDLHFDPDALAQVKLGMANVVLQGSGNVTPPPGIDVAAKTGTADAPALRVSGKDDQGKPITQLMPAVARGGAETETPWYRSTDDKGKGLVHGWLMGYAPVNHPQIAFCVVIEYSGASGGPSAGPIVTQILNACVSTGHLHPTAAAVPGATTTDTTGAGGAAD